MSRRLSPVQAIAVVLSGNLVLALAKIAYGEKVHSIGLRADGFHNLVDALGSVVALIAARLASQPPDSDHPYGHRRFEVLGALGVGLFIAAGAIEIGWAGLLALIHPTVVPRVDAIGIAGVGLSTGVALVLSTWEDGVARREGNLLLEADVRHQRLDVIGTTAVTVGLVLSRFGVGRADAISALLVLGVVGYGAFDILARATVALSDAVQIDPAKIREVVRTVPLVRGCHKIRSRGAPGAIYVDLHIQVDPVMPIREAHALGHAVKARVEQTFPGVLDVLVHMEPDEGDDDDELPAPGATPERAVDRLPG